MTNDAVSERARWLSAAGAELPIDADSVFPRIELFFARRANDRRAKLLAALKPVLLRCLESDERIRYVARGIQYHGAELFFSGHLASHYSNQTALVLTDRRLLLLNVRSNGAPRDIKNHVRLGAIRSAERAGLFGSYLRIRLADGQKLLFMGVPGPDKRALSSAIPKQPKGPRSPQPSLEHLCPNCLQVVRYLLTQHMGRKGRVDTWDGSNVERDHKMKWSRILVGASVLLAVGLATVENAGAAPKKRVLSLTYDPILSSGQRLSDYVGWNDVPALRSSYLSMLESKSGYDYEVYQALVIDAFPRKADGFRYTEASYLACMNDSNQCHQPDLVDYAHILDLYDACELFNQGLIDEVLLFGGPYFGYWESTLAGPPSQAYWYNSSPVAGTSCSSLLPIMGFSSHVGVGNMLHNLGHRTESTMVRVYGSWNHDVLQHNWDRFSLNPHDSPGFSYGGCGNVHYPPNTTIEYGYDDHIVQSSFCDQFFNYPTVNPAVRRSFDCTEWGCTQLGYLSWWFDHIPKNIATPSVGAPDTHSWSWWRYIVDPNHILWEEQGGRGKPRVQYAREYWVIDSRATLSEVLQIVAEAYPNRITVGFSYDDAGIGNLNTRKVVVWGDEHDRDTLRNWYQQYYGGVTVEFRAIPGRGTWHFGPYSTTAPAGQLGTPRVQYAREYWVVNSGASLFQLQEIVGQAYAGRNTVGFSYDDAGIGDLDERRVVVWGDEYPAPVLRAWYRTNYPAVDLSFRAYPGAQSAVGRLRGR